MTSRLVFLDTETTGLSLADHIWDFAAIVREPGEPDVEIQTYVQHGRGKGRRLPEPFRSRYEDRYDDKTAMNPAAFATLVAGLLADRAHVVGAVPNFDTERLALLLAAHGIRAPWHYHLIDVECLVIGRLAARGFPTGLLTPPWESDHLSLAVGIDPADYDRHSAIGDARWARDLYDKVMAG